MLNLDNKKRIVLTGGGTAGHVLPNVALLPYLENYEVHYIGSQTGIERDILSGYKQITYHAVEVAKLRRSFSLSNLAIPLKILRGCRQAKHILKQIQPCAIFSKGGFVSYPAVRAGAKLKIPVIIHESDLSLGLANKMSIKYADTVLTTFDATAMALKNKCQTKKILPVGAPLRQQIYNGKREVIDKLFSRHSNGFATRNLLVIGGSLGSRAINDAIQRASSQLAQKGWRILHVCGRGKTTHLEKAQGGSTVQGYLQMEYIDNIHDAVDWADVVVSRAGSNSICELMVAGKPTVFVPLETGRGDQIQNANFIAGLGVAQTVQESKLDVGTLVAILEEVFTRRKELSAKAVEFGKTLDGTKQIAELLRGFID